MAVLKPIHEEPRSQNRGRLSLGHFVRLSIIPLHDWALVYGHLRTQISLCNYRHEVSIMANNQDKGSNQGGNANTNPGNFANDREKASEAGHKGGQMSGGNFKNDPERASEAGHKGGQASGGNFKNDPERASEAGHKGGQASGGNFANDREKASEAGRVGGQHSHGGGRKSDDNR